MTTTTTENTPAGTAVAALRKSDQRWHHVFELAGFLGHDGKPVAEVAVVINSKEDDLQAITTAHEVAAQRAKGIQNGAETFKKDPIIYDSLANVEALWRAFRQPGKLDRHAFLTPAWMLEHFEEDQLSALAQLYKECRRKKGPAPWEITPAWIDAVRSACAAAAQQVVDTAPLAAMSREYLADFVMAAMVQWEAEERRLLARIEELEAHVSGQGSGPEPSAAPG